MASNSEMVDTSPEVLVSPIPPFLTAVNWNLPPSSSPISSTGITGPFDHLISLNMPRMNSGGPRVSIPDFSENGIGSYTALQWTGPFAGFPLVCIPTIGDGSCFFHAVCHAFFTPYRTGVMNGVPISKKNIITDVRRNLAVELGRPVDPLNPEGPRHYDLLGRGNLSELGKSLPEFSFPVMQQKLDSDSFVGNEYNEFISNQLNKDIYILDKTHQDVYMVGEADDLLFKGRTSLVILYYPGHYELGGLMDESGKISTHFASGNPLIEAIRKRMGELRLQGSVGK